MKLFYGCMGRLFAYIPALSKVVSISTKIFLPATNGHRLVMSIRYLILIFCFIMFSYGFARPQSPTSRETVINSNIVPLKIGDQIPGELWNLTLQVVNSHDGARTVTLGNYKEKLIILDFWSTWCAPCIKNFPKLHALQNEFGDKIKVLAVTQEDAEKINTFFKTGAGKEHTYVNSVINDKVLSGYFPHKTVPHIVWINPNGVVIYTTPAEEITKENIEQVLNGHIPSLKAKVDIDQDRPLFLSEYFGDDMELRSYSIFAKGHYAGLPSGNKIKRTKEGRIYGRRMTNATMMDIYRPILSALFEKNGERFNPKRMIIDVREPHRLDLIAKLDGTFENYNLYSYELTVPVRKADSLFSYMLADLNRYSDYTGSIENRMVDCLVLVRTSSKDKLRSKGQKRKILYLSSGVSFTNCSLGHVLHILNNETPLNLPIIDETGYLGNIDVEIADFTNIDKAKKELNKYDLDLIIGKRSLPMFILKDK